MTQIDDTVDEVSRHLLCARSKIEAVELEFAQIMGELAAYSERLPAPGKSERSLSAAPAASPPSAPPAKRRGDAARGQEGLAEYFFVGTPLGPREDAGNFSMTSNAGAGRQLVESLGE